MDFMLAVKIGFTQHFTANSKAQDMEFLANRKEGAST